MSKQSALNMALGQSAPQATPSLVVSPTATQPLPPASSQPVPVPTPEPTPAIAAEAPKDTVTAQRLALFAKKEAQLQKEREQFKKEQLEKRSAVERAENYNKKWEEFESLKSKDRIAAMKFAGFTDTDIFNFAAEVDSTKPKTPDQIAAEIEQRVEKKVDEKLQAKEQKTTQDQNTKLITNFKAKIRSDLREKSANYELAAFEGKEAEDLAYHFVVEHLKANDELLTTDQALSKVEKFYELKEEQKRTKVKKLQTQSPVPAPQAQGSTVVEAKKSPTLTNRVTATTTSTVASGETKAQKRARLEQALRDGTVIR